MLALLAVLSWPVRAVDPPPLVFVAARNNTLPLAHFDGDRLESGLLRDLGDLLAERLGRRAKYLTLPARRTERALVEGQADLMCYVMPAWVSVPLNWSVPVLPDAQLLVARSDAPKLESLQQLAGRRVGTVLGYTYPKPQQLLGEQLRREGRRAHGGQSAQADGRPPRIRVHRAAGVVGLPEKQPRGGAARGAGAGALHRPLRGVAAQPGPAV
jgi:hypothetical protein